MTPLIPPAPAIDYRPYLAFTDPKEFSNRPVCEPGGDAHLSYSDNLIKGELGSKTTAHILYVGDCLKVFGVYAFCSR